MNETQEPEVTTHYKGKVEIKFYPASHQYWVRRKAGGLWTDWKRKKGVTTFIGIKDKSTPLRIWQQQITADYLLNKISKKEKINIDAVLEAVVQCDVLSKEAADIGKEIHSWCELYIRNKLKQPGFESIPDMPKFPEAITGVNSFFAWEKAHKVKYVATETKLYSMKYDYVGTEDLLAVIDDKLCDSDFKSSNGLYNGVRMQTAGYASARMEEGGKKCQGRWAIRFSKYSEAEYLAREERKREIRKALCRIQNKPYKEYPIKPYQVFEAKFLDNDPSFFKRDMAAFQNAMELHAWDQATDPFYQGENW